MCVCERERTRNSEKKIFNSINSETVAYRMSIGTENIAKYTSDCSIVFFLQFKNNENFTFRNNKVNLTKFFIDQKNTIKFCKILIP